MKLRFLFSIVVLSIGFGSKIHPSDSNPTPSTRDPELVFAGAYAPRYFPGQPLGINIEPWSPKYAAYKRWLNLNKCSRYGCQEPCYAPGYRH